MTDNESNLSTATPEKVQTKRYVTQLDTLVCLFTTCVLLVLYRWCEMQISLWKLLLYVWQYRMVHACCSGYLLQERELVSFFSWCFSSLISILGFYAVSSLHIVLVTGNFLILSVIVLEI